MRSFDPSQPLIFIHVPKTAGTSVRDVVERWFAGRVHRNYFNAAAWRIPDPLPPEQLWNPEAPPVIYGHFNRDRGFGIEDLYPDVRQFVTILRDPFETLVSTYFYARRRQGGWKNRDVPDRLETFLRTERPNYLNHFPSGMTMDNYRDLLEEQFVEIGVTEYLPESLQRIAVRLGVDFDPAMLKTLNVSRRDQQVPEEARARFAETYPLEQAVYDYAKARYASASAPGQIAKGTMRD